ncbi:hypothetical protein [Helicobacter bizzozeronii]|uniref:hypothetical protein n=1 Tax=Helicobacter bizzozeronii TaxID=56877 RepID=UPI000CF02F7F|nr:hypothetical protein [Helicobacter bizzozeronii]
MATKEQTRKELEGILTKWRARVLAFFDGLALEVLRTHFIAFDRLLAGVDRGVDGGCLYLEIYRQQVAIFKHIRCFCEKLHAQISLDDPKCQEIFALSPGRNKEDQMQERLAQVLKDSLQELKENVRQSIVAVQRTLKNRLNKETNLLEPCSRRVRGLEIQSKGREKGALKFAFKHFIASYGLHALQTPKNAAKRR